MVLFNTGTTWYVIAVKKTISWRWLLVSLLIDLRFAKATITKKPKLLFKKFSHFIEKTDRLPFPRPAFRPRRILTDIHGIFNYVETTKLLPTRNEYCKINYPNDWSNICFERGNRTFISALLIVNWINIWHARWQCTVQFPSVQKECYMSLIN